MSADLKEAVAIGSSFGTVKPHSPVPGQAFFNTTTNTMQVYDGTQWQDLGGEIRQLDWEFIQDGPEVWVVELHSMVWAVNNQHILEEWIESSPHNSLMNTHDNRLLLFLYSEADATYFRLRFAD